MLNKGLGLLTSLLSLVIITILSVGGDARVKSGVLRHERETCKLLVVIDGDTVLVRCGAKGAEKVRMIGIDAPEATENEKLHRDAKRLGRAKKFVLHLGEESSAYLKEILRRSDLVTLEFDLQERDPYGRLLAYIYTSGGEMINEKLLKAGYARTYTFPPNVKYVDKFTAASRKAREERRGLWSEVNKL